MTARRRVELVYFNAGGGHRAAANALEQVFGAGSPHEVRKTNVMEVLDPSGYFKRLTGMAPEDYYNKRLATGFTAGLAQELKVFQGVVRLAHPALVGVLEQHWLRSEPDVVVSLIPNLNRALCASVNRVLPGVPFVTVMTDLADLPPDFWIVPDQPQHVVCGTPAALAQAMALGCEPSRVHAASGMILRPDFYRQGPLDRASGRRALGLDPQRPTGLVLFGGHGSRAMLPLAEDLHDVQLIFLCGHNARLANRLRALPAGRAARAVVDFTPDVHRYMRLADFFIGKPGPGSLSEAVHCGLPVVTVLNTWTMPQERFNPRWIAEQGLGVAGASFTRLRREVMHLLARLPAYAERVRALPPNRAVFEVAALVGRMLDEAAHPGAGHTEVTSAP